MTYHSGNELIDPFIIFEKAQLQKGMHIADLGCGKIGHIVFSSITHIGKEGLVYAVDIMKEALDSIHKRAKVENIMNIHTVWADLEKPRASTIPDQSVDIAFFVNTLHQATDMGAMLQEAKRILKPKARLVIVDWKTQGLPFAPDAHHLVPFSRIIEWARDEQMGIQEDVSIGKYHRMIICYRHD